PLAHIFFNCASVKYTRIKDIFQCIDTLFITMVECICFYIFLENSDFNCMFPFPGTRQSMSLSPSLVRISVILVPGFSTIADPFSFRSLSTVTLPPSCSSVPCASRVTDSGVVSSTSSPVHSWAHSGQTNRCPSSYVYAESHCGQFGK